MLMNTVESSVSRQVLVWALGSAMAASSVGTSAEISGLRMTEPTCSDDAVFSHGLLTWACHEAGACTRGHVSHDMRQWLIPRKEVPAPMETGGFP